MEDMVYKAAIEGNVSSLLDLLQHDPLLLDRCMTGNYTETPLHVASMLGHVEFVEILVKKKPELVVQRDSQRSTALHLASAKGYIEIVKHLVRIEPGMCLAQDRYGRNPVHVAAIKGRNDVLREMLRVMPKAAWDPTDHGETVLHLCARYAQIEALKYLLGVLGISEFLNTKDHEGNTVLHIATIHKDLELTKFLISSPGIYLNSLNNNGLTALDILEMMARRDGNDIDIASMLRDAGGTKSKNTLAPQQQEFEATRKQPQARTEMETFLNNIIKPGMVAASVVAAATFQAVVNPPGGVWQQSFGNYTAGRSVLADLDPLKFKHFSSFNTVAFLSSLSIFLLLLSTLLVGSHRVIIGFLLYLMITAIIFTFSSYATSLQAISPLHHQSFSLLHLCESVFISWGIISGVLLGHGLCKRRRQLP